MDVEKSLQQLIKIQCVQMYMQLAITSKMCVGMCSIHKQILYMNVCVRERERDMI